MPPLAASHNTALIRDKQRRRRRKKKNEKTKTKKEEEQRKKKKKQTEEAKTKGRTKVTHPEPMTIDQGRLEPPSPTTAVCVPNLLFAIWR